MYFGTQEGTILQESVILEKLILKSVPSIHDPPLISWDASGDKSTAPEAEDVWINTGRMKTQRGSA